MVLHRTLALEVCYLFIYPFRLFTYCLFLLIDFVVILLFCFYIQNGRIAFGYLNRVREMGQKTRHEIQKHVCVLAVQLIRRTPLL